MLRVLGSLELDPQPAGQLGGPRERRVLAVLAAAEGEVVSSDALVDAVWPGSPPPTATKTLQAYIARLRKALAGTVEIHTRAPGYVLVAADDALDAKLVRRLAREARAALVGEEFETALRLLDEALGQWRGLPFAEFAEEAFARAAVSELCELRAALIEDRVDAQLALGHHAALVSDLEALVTEEPLRERRWAQLVLALYRSGRQADALHAYARARRVLAEELGLEPGPALRDLEAQILRQDESLDGHHVVARRSSALPTGSVTFLLTDVEASTRHWETAPDEMGEWLERHDAVIADAVERHEGVLLKSRGEGDSSFSVFERPSRAVHAALDIQVGLHDVLPPMLRVRVAVHTGEVALRDGDYYGTEVNRAARLRGIAHGGQVLVSQATAALVRDVLSQAAVLRDLGTHRFRDLSGVERVYQLVHPDLPDDFPPLRSLEAALTNLPPQSTSFVGRTTALRHLRGLIARHPLVTLMGPGGAGKTRLALQVGADLVSDFPDGVWFVDLAPLPRPDLVPSALARAVGVRERPGVALLDAVVEHLRSRRALLILDNCEHVIDACASTVRALVSVCPDVRVLATSRTRLGLSDETTWLVEPLRVPSAGDDDVQAEAVQLFVDRARAVDATFSITPENIGAVAAICRRLDGLPLAIELAAARASVLSPEEIAPRLERTFALLASQRRDVLPRQQTMRAALDWSHALLSEPERALFRRLAVFEGGFSMSAAEAVTAGEPVAADDVVDLVARLLEQSLLTRDSHSPPRFRLLAVVRQYALELLDRADEESELRAAHARWCLELVDNGALGLRPLSALAAARLAREHQNISASLSWALTRGDEDIALRLAGGFAPVWLLRGQWQEGARWLRDALALAGQDSPERLVAGVHYAAIAHMLGERGTAKRWCLDVIRDADAHGLPQARARALVVLSEVVLEEGEREEAARLAEQAIVAAGEEDLGNRGRARHALALASGEVDDKRALLRAAAADASHSGEDLIAAITLFKLAKLSDDPEEARAARQRALVLVEALDNPEGRSALLLDAAVDAAARGDLAEATASLNESLRLLRGLSHGRHLPYALIQGALALYAVGGHSEALHLARQAHELGVLDAPRAWIAAAHTLLAAVARDECRSPDAVASCRRALQHAIESASPAALLLAVATAAALVLKHNGPDGLATQLRAAVVHVMRQSPARPSTFMFDPATLSHAERLFIETEMAASHDARGLNGTDAALSLDAAARLALEWLSRGEDDVS